MKFLLFPLLLQLVMPNGKILEYERDGDVKVYRLIAEEVTQEFTPGLVVNCWGYNGCVPGPVIEAVEGDRVRIYVTNHLPEYTTVHWHGIILPNGMDGVVGLNQPPIYPGETFLYEFTLVQNGTFMYHPHADEVTQMGMGMGGFFIIHPCEEENLVERDYCILTQEWALDPGTYTPNPMTNDFNVFTLNGKVFPGTESLLAQEGEKVRIRFGNLSMESHPMHLHGHEFIVTRKGGQRLSPEAQYTAVTVNVAVGDTADIEFCANNPGDWAIHCHKAHHVMNGMVHGLTSMLGVNLPPEAIKKIKRHIPSFMPMGINGMAEMFTGEPMPHAPPNVPPFGAPGPFGVIDMGGMFTLLKTRTHIEPGVDPGWYDNPPGTVARKVASDSAFAPSSTHHHH